MRKLYQNKLILRLFSFVSLLFLTSTVNVTYAVSVDDLLIDFGDILNDIRGIVLPVAVAAGIFLILLNGYKILSSEGDPQRVQDGKQGLTSAIIGLIFVLLAGSILRIILGGLLDVN